LPDNTLPMMTGTGQFGPIEMGGMFTTVKVRKDQAKNDYKDPGDYTFPKNSVAYEWNGESMNPITAPTSRGGDIDPATGKVKEIREMTVTVRKPGQNGHKH
ncbi:MAG: copper oxidase, partial [Burkholderiales bacterium]